MLLLFNSTDGRGVTLQVGKFQLAASTNSKCAVLFQFSKVFDPLVLYLPVLNKGKFLIKELWASKLEWDEVIPEETLKK